MTDNPNAAQVDYWNSPGTSAWSDHPEPIDRLFVPLTETLLDFAAVRPGERILDIGCATGTTLLDLAARTGPAGHVLGADIAEKSVARAQRRIAAAGLANAAAELADVSTYRFQPNQFDLAFSRFGVMFFIDPVATFRHLRAALKPTGRLAIAAWRAPRENPWATGARAAIADLLAPLPMPGPEEPGQFAWADPDRVRRILGEAGFHDVVLAKHDPPMRLAAPGQPQQAIEFMLQTGPLGAATRAAAPETQAILRARLADFFRPHETAQGIVFPGAIWLVGARP